MWPVTRITVRRLRRATCFCTFALLALALLAGKPAAAALTAGEFEALIGAMGSEKADCQRLAETISTADVPGAEARLADLVVRTHPQAGVHFARRLADREYFAAEPALLQVLARTKLDGTGTLAAFASEVARLGTTASLNAVARKLIEIAAIPDEPRQAGRIHAASPSSLPLRTDGSLCGELAMFSSLPLGDSPSRTTRELIRSILHAPADAVLDRALFSQRVVAAVPAERRKEIADMLDARAKSEAMARDITTENFMHWLGRGDIRQAKRFIAAGIDVNAPDANGIRPLFATVRGVQPELVALLLQAGARVREPNADRDGATPLHPAAALRPELVPLLLAAGADVKAADRNGTTALHMAVRGKKLATAKLLLERGAEVNAEEFGGVTPLLIARDLNAAELEALLTSHGGRVNLAYVVKRGLVRLFYGAAATVTGGH